MILHREVIEKSMTEFACNYSLAPDELHRISTDIHVERFLEGLGIGEKERQTYLHIYEQAKQPTTSS